jgi:polyferredoxin
MEKTDRSVQRRDRRIRLAVLAAVLVAITGIGYVHQVIPGVAPAGVDALCPFGGIETLWTLMTTGAFVSKIAASSIVLLVAVVLIALLFRRSFCGMICPLGFLQELAGKLGIKVMRRRQEMPAAIDKPARYLKYAVLAVFTVWTWQAADLVMRPYDPWATWQHLTSAEVLTEFSVGLVVLGVSVAGSFVYDRFFCKYACPMGAFLGLISKVGLYRVHREESVCTSCGACDKACPVNLSVSTSTDVISAECLNCNECVNVCPAKGALNVTAPKATRELKPGIVLGAVVGLFALVLVATTATGTFSWTTKSLTATVEAGATFDPGNINGRSSIAEVAKASGIEEEKLLAQFKVPASEAGRPMKEIKDTYGFSPEDVKTWVGEQLAAK